MAERTPRIRVTLIWVQILDDLEPPWAESGQFCFTARVETAGNVQHTRIPPEGRFSISDHPAWNRRRVNRVIYEGEAGDQLIVDLRGVEHDILSPDDELEPYSRTFTGDPESWVGEQSFADAEPEDPESLSNWRVCYWIELVEGEED